MRSADNSVLVVGAGPAGATAARALARAGVTVRLLDRSNFPRDSVLIQRNLFADRRGIAKVIDGATRAQAMTRLILDFAVGRLSYPVLRRRLLAAAPLLAGRLIWDRLRALGALLRVPGPDAEGAGR